MTACGVVAATAYFCTFTDNAPDGEGEGEGEDGGEQHVRDERFVSRPFSEASPFGIGRERKHGQGLRADLCVLQSTTVPGRIPGCLIDRSPP